ncbi:hypothetical protein [Nakamurella sp.]|uniref:hypothetical protein n=1 Tax=Nakamurella sp. TaxID=1869182 RepID=UPI003B3B8AF5
MTAQTPDTIRLDGQDWLLLGTPLDPVLASAGVTRRLVAPHTANVRGYVATWRVDADGRLFLDAVTATVRGLGSGIQTIQGSAVLRGATLPMPADFVTGQLRLARGEQVRHVHSGFDSVWADEILLEVDAGRVRSRRDLAPASAMGTAGPYQLHEPLLGTLTGGGFGQVIAATDLDGTRLVAKAPLPRGGGNRTEVWFDTPAGRRPEHKPAEAFRADPAGFRSVEIGADLTAAVLRREAEILERDGGRLLPRSLGLWPHEPSGLPVLVMERLVGESPETPGDVDLVLAALADAVDRGTFDAHGDVKPEHVFIEDGVVRMCDPAPRFDDPQLRGLTPAYNPRGWVGPAADVAACASILRYLPDAADHEHAGWRWCAAVLDSATPPPWIHSHRAALAELRRELAPPRVPPPVGWTVPPFPHGGAVLPGGPGAPAGIAGSGGSGAAGGDPGGWGAPDGFGSGLPPVMNTGPLVVGPGTAHPGPSGASGPGTGAGPGPGAAGPGIGGGPSGPRTGTGPSWPGPAPSPGVGGPGSSGPGTWPTPTVPPAPSSPAPLPPGPTPPPWVSPAPADEPTFAMLALILRASVLEPVDPTETRAGGVFVVPSDHAVAALDTILQALAATIDGHARRFGVRRPQAPEMAVMVRRAGRDGVTGLLAQTVSMSPVSVAPDVVYPERSVDLAWNAIAATDLAAACQHLAAAGRPLSTFPDPRLALAVVELAQRVGGILTVVRRHIVDAVRDGG